MPRTPGMKGSGSLKMGGKGMKPPAPKTSMAGKGIGAPKGGPGMGGMGAPPPMPKAPMGAGPGMAPPMPGGAGPGAGPGGPPMPPPPGAGGGMGGTGGFAKGGSVSTARHGPGKAVSSSSGDAKPRHSRGGKGG
jgi:hypothetical protein